MSSKGSFSWTINDNKGETKIIDLSRIYFIYLMIDSQLKLYMIISKDKFQLLTFKILVPWQSIDLINNYTV